MPWNWEIKDWPNFTYDHASCRSYEKEFILRAGKLSGVLSSLSDSDYTYFKVEILTSEGETSSKIEGEILDRKSLQSSIRKNFELEGSFKKGGIKESSMASLLKEVYASHNLPLSCTMLLKWHKMLMGRGEFRNHPDPMQIVSNKMGDGKVYFEAPPSGRVVKEMSGFVNWFNSFSKDHSHVIKSALSHVYFESIHPFEDGNGRIGRALAEKVISDGFDKPLLISLSKVLEKERKEYYKALERCNRTLEITPWVIFFSEAVLRAQKESLELLLFLTEKSKFFLRLKGRLSPRQEKVLVRIFDEGIDGFKGGLSAKNYISIAKVSRATATRDLHDLVEKKALRKTGELRYARYYLSFIPFTY